MSSNDVNILVNYSTDKELKPLKIISNNFIYTLKLELYSEEINCKINFRNPRVDVEYNEDSSLDPTIIQPVDNDNISIKFNSDKGGFTLLHHQTEITNTLSKHHNIAIEEGEIVEVNEETNKDNNGSPNPF